jgi:short-subunit dehydrogenase
MVRRLISIFARATPKIMGSHAGGRDPKPCQIALIAGGSRGIGLAIAEEFAAHGHPLGLVARNPRTLQMAADGLRRDYGVSVRTYALDLTDRDASEHLELALARDGRAVKYLIVNAGYWSRGSVAAAPFGEIERVVETNILAPLRLVKVFLPQVSAAGGGILFISSLAALLPTPTFASYGASKAFITSLSIAMRQESKARKAMICVVLPGLVRTEFISPKATAILYRICASTPATVARAAYRGFLSGQSTVVPGLLSRVLYFGIKNLPGGITKGIFNAATERYH